ALHARLPRRARMDLFDARWACGLCGLREAVGGDGQACIAGLPAACRGRSRSYLRDRGGDGRCDRLQFITAPLTKDELAELIQIPERRRCRRVSAGKIGKFETPRTAEGVEPCAAARPRRQVPAGCLTPQTLHSPRRAPRFVSLRRGFVADRCRKHAPNKSESA